jgi:ADP-ribose pyrophosphatase YjhB (NUDIX family)
MRLAGIREQHSMEPQWLNFARRIQAIAQTGLHYEPSLFDRERYEKLLDIAAEMIAAYSDSDMPRVRELFDTQDGHATPKVDVRGVVFHENKILLVRENLDGGRWTLPGGWADPGEAPGEATAREIYEETGYRTRAVKLLAFYDRRLHGHGPHIFSIYKAFFRCELLDNHRSQAQIDNQSASYIETGEVRFFAEHEIPADLSIGRVTQAQIRRFFEHLRQPDLPADFD